MGSVHRVAGLLLYFINVSFLPIFFSQHSSLAQAHSLRPFHLAQHRSNAQQLGRSSSCSTNLLSKYDLIQSLTQKLVAPGSATSTLTKPGTPTVYTSAVGVSFTLKFPIQFESDKPASSVFYLLGVPSADVSIAGVHSPAESIPDRKIWLVDENGSVLSVTPQQIQGLVKPENISSIQPTYEAAKVFEKNNHIQILSAQARLDAINSLIFPEINYFPPPKPLQTVEEVREYAQKITGRPLGKILGIGAMKLVFEDLSDSSKVVKVFFKKLKFFKKSKNPNLETAQLLQRHLSLARFLRSHALPVPAIDTRFVEYGILIEDRIYGQPVRQYFASHPDLLKLLEFVKKFSLRIIQVIDNRYDILLGKGTAIFKAVGIDINENFHNVYVTNDGKFILIDY